MFIAEYVAESGKIETCNFNALEDARSFFKELAKKNIVTKRSVSSDTKLKDRTEELDSLLEYNDIEIRNEIKDNSKLLSLIEDRVKYEIEKTLLKRKVY